jgi:hypothetical protein
MATLADIKRKVRILTSSQSTAQLTDANLLDYINTFTLYDMPYKDIILNLKKTLRFYTAPNIPYYLTSILATKPLYNLKNKYINMTGPVRIGGNIAELVTSHELFSRYYQETKYRETIATGNSVDVAFAATLSYKPVIQNTVTISSYYTGPFGDRRALVLSDVPTTINGQPLTVGTFIDPNDPTARGTINYITGLVTPIFTNPPANVSIEAEYSVASVGMPYVLFLFNDVMHLRPVPDKTYSVTIDAIMSPAAFEDDADIPELEQWWQYIAYGTAKKILEDRKDLEGVQLIMPGLKEQETLITRKKTLQLSESKSVTAYETYTLKKRGWYFDDTLY